MNRAILALLAAILASASCGAAAGDYSDAVMKQSRCESAGELARSFHGKTRSELQAVAKDLNAKARAKEISEALATGTKHILLIGKNSSSPKDAYMQAWAWCMDQK